jgi:hypothetical protein
VWFQLANAIDDNDRRHEEQVDYNNKYPVLNRALNCLPFRDTYVHPSFKVGLLLFDFFLFINKPT